MRIRRIRNTLGEMGDGLHVAGENAEDTVYRIASQHQSEAQVDKGQVECLHRQQAVQRNLGCRKLFAPHIEDHLYQGIAQEI
jgi:hypothetical protein